MCPVFGATLPLTLQQAYLLLVDPIALNGIPYFKLVMFAIVSVLASCLWGMWYCCSWKKKQQQQPQSLQTALLDNASINNA